MRAGDVKKMYKVPTTQTRVMLVVNSQLIATCMKWPNESCCSTQGEYDLYHCVSQMFMASEGSIERRVMVRSEKF